MGNLEKKIVQNAAWVLSVVAGYLIAEQVYNKGMLGYMKTFHSNEYNNAIKELEENKA